MAKIADVELHIGKGLLVDYLRLWVPGDPHLLYFTNRIDAQKAYDFLTTRLAVLGGQSAKSYVDEEAGKIKLLSYHYRDAWIIAEDTLTILDYKKERKAGFADSPDHQCQSERSCRIWSLERQWLFRIVYWRRGDQRNPFSQKDGTKPLPLLCRKRPGDCSDHTALPHQLPSGAVGPVNEPIADGSAHC